MLDLNITDIERLKELVRPARRVVITCHVAPDGDAVGSTLAMYHLLTAMGKRPAVVTPDLVTASLLFLPGARDIIAASKYTERAMVHFQTADLVICLDFNAMHRVDKLSSYLESTKAPRILIDHHIDPESWPDLTISRPQASSTCYLLYEVIKAAGWEEYMSTEAAECLYTGMMTDTGNFSYNSNDPRLYIDIAELLGYGINKDRIYKLACDTFALDQIRLNGFAISSRMKVYPEHKAAIIALSKADLDDYHYVKGYTEGLVNVPLSVPDITYSIFMRQDEENFVKLSLRSKGSFPVNKICTDHFGGGGHLNAAGGELYCSLDEAYKKVVEVLPQYDKYIK